jgi:hypothetical protein
MDVTGKHNMEPEVRKNKEYVQQNATYINSKMVQTFPEFRTWGSAYSWASD